MRNVSCLLASMLLLIATQAYAAPSSFPSSDLLGSDGRLSQSGQHIRNESGSRCTFKIYKYPAANFFHENLTSITHVLEFDDSSCMEIGEARGSANISSINQHIARDYSHDNADWQVEPEHLKEGSLMQVRGQCIQSATYPNMGVAVAYVVGDGAVTHVIHSSSIQGCT